ncbi:hypothetical protein [Ekhidna sp.]
MTLQQNLIPISSLPDIGISYSDLNQNNVQTTELDGTIYVAKKHINRFLRNKDPRIANRPDLNILFLEALNDWYVNHLHLFKDYEGIKKIHLAKKYTFFLLYLTLRENPGVKKKQVYKIQKLVNKEYYSNIRSFYKFVEDLNTKNLLKKIRHNTKGRKHLSKYRDHEEWIQLEIEELYKRRKSINEITKYLNPMLKLKGLPKISPSTVSNRLSSYLRNLYSLQRFDYKYVKQKILGYENRYDPSFIMQVVEADGSRYQIIGIDEDTNSIVFISFYAILDLCSDKIIGVNCGLSENRWMVLNAFYDMTMRTGHLPSVIRIDGASPHTSDEVKSLIRRSSCDYGSLWINREVGEPQIDGTIEKFFQDFHDKLVSDHPDYVGLSMVSTTPKKRLKYEIYNRAYNNKSSLLSTTEIKKLLLNHLGLWNSSTKNGETISRDLKFENGEYLDAKPIPHHEIAKLFWHHDKIKFQRQRFRIMNGEYELLSFENTMKLSSGYHSVYYDESNPDFVYAFKEDGEYLGKATKKPIWLNDPKRISKTDRYKIKKRRKNRKAIVPRMKQESKAKTKRLEEIRFEDPQIQFYLNQKKEESSKIILDTVEYNFQLKKKKNTVTPSQDHLTAIDSANEFISQGVKIEI